MDNGISNEYIENAIEELAKFVGVKKPVSIDDFISVKKSNVKEATKAIAQQLGLPIDIHIGDDKFSSTQLAKRHESGSEGIIAQVLIPSYLPMYGDPSLNNFLINVKISESCTTYPLVFTSVMAHELSHVLLHSLNHPHKENEFYTDLTAMILGFKDIFSNGRKVTHTTSYYGSHRTTTTTTYGYLNDEQFDFALNKIDSILEDYEEQENCLFHKITELIDTLSKYERTLHELQKRLDFLAKHTNIKILSKDGKKISNFFQPGYIENFQPSINYTKSKLKDKQSFFKNIAHFTNKTLSGIENYFKELTTYSEHLNKNLLIIKKDKKILWKYVGYRYRINVFYNRYCNRNKK